MDPNKTPKKTLDRVLSKAKGRPSAHVLKLVRVRVGSIAIGRLQIGKWRLLTRAEIAALK